MNTGGPVACSWRRRVSFDLLHLLLGPKAMARSEKSVNCYGKQTLKLARSNDYSQSLTSAEFLNFAFGQRP